MTSHEEKSLDAAFSQYIRTRDPICKICQSAKTENCAHIYSRKAYPAIRYDKENALGTCFNCHRWGHDHMKEWGWIMESMFGKAYLRKLRYRGRLKRYKDYQSILKEITSW